MKRIIFLLLPVLFLVTVSAAEAEETPLPKVKFIIIDPGHGGYENGITTADYKEKNVVLEIAKRVCAMVNRDSTRCLLTRKSDLFMSLRERINFTDSNNAEIFLSIHVGKHGNFVIYTPVIIESVPKETKAFLVKKGQEGFETKSEALSNALRQAITDGFGKDMVSTKPLPYSILSEIEAGTLLIELPSFEDAYYVAEFETEVANTIYKGLYLYEQGTTN